MSIIKCPLYKYTVEKKIMKIQGKYIFQTKKKNRQNNLIISEYKFLIILIIQTRLVKISDGQQKNSQKKNDCQKKHTNKN